MTNSKDARLGPSSRRLQSFGVKQSEMTCVVCYLGDAERPDLTGTNAAYRAAAAGSAGGGPDSGIWIGKRAIHGKSWNQQAHSAASLRQAAG